MRNAHGRENFTIQIQLCARNYQSTAVVAMCSLHLLRKRVLKTSLQLRCWTLRIPNRCTQGFAAGPPFVLQSMEWTSRRHTFTRCVHIRVGTEMSITLPLVVQTKRAAHAGFSKKVNAPARARQQFALHLCTQTKLTLQLDVMYTSLSKGAQDTLASETNFVRTISIVRVPDKTMLH